MLITNFSSGELSKNLNGRVDLQSYYQGAAKLQNFSIIPTGGIKRRVGFKRVKAISHNSRLIPFILNKTLTFIFELYDSNLIVWEVGNDGELTQLQNAIEIPYNSLAKIKELQYAQNYDTIVFAHTDYAPFMLKWNGSTQTFSGSSMTFNFEPSLNIDDDYGQICICNANMQSTPVVTSTQTGGYSVTFTNVKGDSETKTYKAGDTPYCVYDANFYYYDSVIGWTEYGNDNIDRNMFTTSTKYPGCVAFFNNRMYLAKTGANPQKIWASSAPDAKDVRYNNFATFNKYITVNRVIKDADMHTFTCDMVPMDYTSVTGRKYILLTNITFNYEADGALIKPLSEYYFTGEDIPVGTKSITNISSTPGIMLDAEPDFTETKTGMVCTMQLWRNSENPSADDYEYVVTSNNVTSADNSFNFELASDQNDAIMFLSSNKFLAAGTESSIWSIASGSNALQVMAEMQGRYGSDEIQGQAIGTATIFFAQGKKGIREFYYDQSNEAFRTNNIALMSEQMLEESPVVDFDYVTNPYNRIICCRNDGMLATLLYDKNNGVMGWTRVKCENSEIKNIAVVRGTEQNDLIYAVVENDNNYFIELYDDNNRIFLDSWKIYNPEDEEPADGYTSDAFLYNVSQDTTCEVGSIPTGFIGENDTVYIGYKYVSDIISMPLVKNNGAENKRIVSLSIRFLESYMPEVKFTDKPNEVITGIVVPYSGIKKVTYPGESDKDVSFELFDDSVYSVNILCLNAQLS